MVKNPNSIEFTYMGIGNLDENPPYRLTDINRPNTIYQITRCIMMILIIPYRGLAGSWHLRYHCNGPGGAEFCA